MRKISKAWFAIAAFTLLMFGNPSFAIDNPDAPDLMAEFKTREQPFVMAIKKPTNTTSDFLHVLPVTE